jgi:ABC-type lipoprotein export system ATPase subunit
LRDAAHARGCAVVVVTHDPHVARQMSRTVRLVDGEINEE